MEPYYYNQMNKTQQMAYHAIKTGLLELSNSILVPRLDNRELADIYFKIRLDCPEIFYTTNFRYRYYQDSCNAELIPEYLFEKGKVKEHRKAMNARVNKLVMPAKSLSEWEKELYIHDFICSQVKYDKLKKAYSHEIIGPLGQGVGVCEGIAKAIKALCDAMGIWCIIAISDANKEKGIKYRHAWNVVKINGSCCHLDATFDNSLSHEGYLRYDYFNLPDKQLYRDHEPALEPVPHCQDGDHFYYRIKKMSFTKEEDVAKRSLQAIRKNKPFIFHWWGGHLKAETVSDLHALLEQTAQQKGKHVKLSLNWSQAVFAAVFSEEQPVEPFVVESANEGEEIG